MIVRTLACVIFVVALIGCENPVKVSAMRLGTTEYPSRPKDYPIAVYEVGSDVSQHWVKVGRISARRSESHLGIKIPQWTQVSEFIGPLKAKARELGADAIILQEGINTDASFHATTKHGEESSARHRIDVRGNILGATMGHSVIAIRYIKSD